MPREIIMHTHPHAALDRFPQLVQDLAREFGREGIEATVEHFIAAEEGDFYWDGRIAERREAGEDSGWDESDLCTRRVHVLGYFRRRYYVASYLADGRYDVERLIRVRHYDDAASAERAFCMLGEGRR